MLVFVCFRSAILLIAEGFGGGDAGHEPGGEDQGEVDNQKDAEVQDQDLQPGDVYGYEVDVV